LPRDGTSDQGSRTARALAVKVLIDLSVFTLIFRGEGILALYAREC
jgi:hypothetical protein